MLIRLRQKAHQAYRALPVLGPIVDAFTDWACRCGYELKSFGSQLGNLRLLDRFFRRRGVHRWQQLTASHFDAAWARLRQPNRTRGCTVRQVQRFLHQVHGLELESPRPLSKSEAELRGYAQYLQRVRGFAEHTIATHTSCLRAFLRFIGYERSTSAITHLGPKRVESFVRAQAKICNRFSLQNVVSCLRGFLRFQFAEGKLARPLHTTIDTPRVYRLERLPRALAWPQVQALLRSVDRRQPHGLRDYTMLFLMAAYGLRSSEVAALTLEDIDWRAGVLRICQRKTRQKLILPLSDEAGDVLQRYLKKGRRPSPQRELFLRVRAPFRALDASSVHDIFNHRLRRSGLDIPAQGTYCLRHAFASRLLRQGASLKAIGDTLGHRDPESTAVYLRLAVDDLRAVGLPVPCDGGAAPIPMPDWKRCLPRVRARKHLDPVATNLFRSGLADALENYLTAKQALGRQFGNESRVLLRWDAFLYQHQGRCRTVNEGLFRSWAVHLEHLSPTVRRSCWRIVRNFLLFHARDHSVRFVPNLDSFPKPVPPRPPRLVSAPEMACLLASAARLEATPNNPLRAQTVRLGLLLLFCCGLRRGELLRLRLAHFDPEANLLRIEETKFHKSRWVPLSPSVAQELHHYVEMRRQSKLPAEQNSYLFWTPRRKDSPLYTGAGLSNAWRQLCLTVGVLDGRGRPPRLHDLRYSFITERLQQWYSAGVNLQNRLVHLSSYVGHVNPASTHYYVQFTPQIREAANQRFHQAVSLLFEEGGLQ